MTGPRTNATRRAALGLACGLACGLLAVGCNSRSQPGGSNSPKAQKARKDAETLAVNAVNAAASAQAKASPDLATRSKLTWFNGRVVVALDPFDVSVNLDPDPGKGPAAPAAPGKTDKADPGKGGATPEPPKPSEPARVAAEKRRTPKMAPRPGPAPLIREAVINSVPYPTEAEAEEEVLAMARDLVERKLAELDPPIHYKPSLNEVKTEFLNKNSRSADWLTEEEKADYARYGVTGNRVYVSYYVEVSPDQVRELRAQERVSSALRVLGALAAVALVGFLFLRADERTKGYLTRWLAVGAVVLAGGAVAALLLV